MTFPNRHTAVAIAALALCVAPGPGHATPEHSVITCTNPTSGAAWTIDVDFAHAMVDGYPASIDAGQIYWKDPKDLRNYTLDRKTGELTVIAASSTGGNIWSDRCKLP